MDGAPRVECAVCARPQVACYCGHVPRLATRSRVLVLQHPREERKAVGTAKIAAQALPELKIAVGVSFGERPEVQRLLSDPERPAVLLYPGPDAVDLAERPPAGPVTLVVIDGTWHQARAILRQNPCLAALPRYALAPSRPSEYRIRRAPRADYISTIEALRFALSALEPDAERFEALLAPFRAMVDTQLAYAARSSAGRRRVRRRGDNAAPARLPAWLCEPNLVCVAGEANAWPHDRALGRPPHAHELVHWTALRLGEGSRFEAVLAPRLPLSRSPIVHARLSPGALEAGIGVAALKAAWHDYLRADDVVCSWGHYASDLLEREGGHLPERRIDIRKVVGDVRRRRPGSLEEVVTELGLDWEPRGQGRAGARLGMLATVTRWLAAMARA